MEKFRRKKWKKFLELGKKLSKKGRNFHTKIQAVTGSNMDTRLPPAT